MKALLLVIILLYSFSATAEECPDPNTPYGAGFTTAAIEIDGSGTLSLKDAVCKIGSPKVKTEIEVTKCKAGYYAALEKKSFALQCLAKLQEQTQ